MPHVEHNQGHGIDGVDGIQPIKVLVLGGSYGGLSTALNLLKLLHGSSREELSACYAGQQDLRINIRIVDERDGFFHLIGAPLALADKAYASKAWVKFEDMPALQHPDISFSHGSVVKIDCQQKVAKIKLNKDALIVEEKYDYLVVATGLRRIWPTVPQSLTRMAYLAEAGGQIDRLGAAKYGVAVIGGVGVEMAAELKLVRPDVAVTLIHSRDMLFSSEPVSAEFQEQVLESVRHAGVEVIMGKRVAKVTGDGTGSTAQKTLKLSDGSQISVSEVIDAVSRPTSTATYLPLETVNDERLIPVSPELHFRSGTPNAETHFAVGDLVARPGIKRCGGAMYMGQMAGHNILQHALYGRGLVKEPTYLQYPEHSPSIALAVGKDAVSYSAEQGVSSGLAVVERFFGADLGLKIVRDHLQLGEAQAGVVA